MTIRRIDIADASRSVVADRSTARLRQGLRPASVRNFGEVSPERFAKADGSAGQASAKATAGPPKPWRRRKRFARRRINCTADGQHSAESSGRRKGRHRVLRRARHERGAPLDARARARFRTPTPRTSGSPTSPTTTRFRGARCSTAPRRRASSTAARSSSPRGSRSCSAALPHLHGRRPVLQHDADRPRRHRHDARRRR